MRWQRYQAWDPFRDVATLRREINRLFEGVPRRASFPIAFLPGRAARSYPLLNVVETEDGYTVHALAPGLDTEKLEVVVKNNVLTLKGEKLGPGDIKPDSFHRNERAAGRFVRTLELPAEIDADKVEAAYRDGLLQVDLPKAEAAKPRQIEVKLG